MPRILPIDPNLPIHREYRVHRGRAASARAHGATPEEIQRLESEMNAAAIRLSITGYVMKSPPLSREQIDTIIGTLQSASRERAAEFGLEAN